MGRWLKKIKKATVIVPTMPTSAMPVSVVSSIPGRICEKKSDNSSHIPFISGQCDESYYHEF